MQVMKIEKIKDQKVKKIRFQVQIKKFEIIILGLKLEYK